MSMGYIRTPRKETTRTVPPQDCMLRFDSGDGITFDDATHHLLVLGTTGSGKTASVFLPALARLLAANHCGLVVDIKGNVRAQVRALAARCGREKDLVEYGTGPDAVPLNILHGMDRHGLYSFFETLTLQSFHNASDHLDWHLKGVNVAADCGYLLKLLNGLDPVFEPSIVTISEMLMRPYEAVKLYKLFKARVYDRDNEEHALFVGSVEANRFHVLKARSESGKNSETTTDEQMTWTLQAVRQALKSFLDAPGVGAHFAAPGGKGLDLGHVLAENKIALLRFDLETGPIGAALARVLLSRLYAAAYARGKELPAGRKCFVAIDEFQEVADFSDGRFSDTSFISQAREFNGIFLASTQSMSSLMQRGNSPFSVEAFISNCNGRIIFYSDDPLTAAMAARYDKDVELNHLEPGTAFVIHYDKALRRHRFGIEWLQTAFASTEDILALHEPPTASCADVSAGALIGLRALADRAEEKCRQPTLNGHQEAQSSGAGGEHVQRSWKEWPGEKSAPISHEEVLSRRKQHTAQEKEKKVITVQKKKTLAEKFPQFFAEDAKVNISIPVGWSAFAERAFNAFAATGLEVTLSSVGLSGNTLRAVEADSCASRLHRSESGATKFLNALLRRSEAICVLCGERICTCEKKSPEFGKERADDEEMFHSNASEALPVCPGCLHRFELDITHVVKSEVL